MFTVIGSKGFIGSNVVNYLTSQGVDCFSPVHGAELNSHLGHVIYCAGVTSDFRVRPIDTIRAHVCDLVSLLEKGNYDSLLYLSSTRVYDGADTTEEESPIKIKPFTPDHLYNSSKALGESACLSIGRNCRVVRLSNVFGKADTSSNFLTDVLRDAKKGGVRFGTALDSEKDYISVSDVVPALCKIALEGKFKIYNLAAGKNTSNREIAETLAKEFQCTICVSPDAPTVKFPPINTNRVQAEFPFAVTEVINYVRTCG